MRLEAELVVHGHTLSRALDPLAIDQQVVRGKRCGIGLSVHQSVSSSSLAGVVITRNTRPCVPVLVKLWRMPGGT